MRSLKALLLATVLILAAFPCLAFAGAAETIDGITQSIPVDGAVVAGISVLFAILADLFFRLYKSDKPRTILTFVAGILGALGALFFRVRDFLVNVSKASDKFLPQRTTGDAGLIDKKP